MSEKFDFKELDEEGLQTLEVISDADKFNLWTYETVARHCKGKILEIGSGIGNISQFFLQKEHDISLSDIRENYRQFLSRKFDQRNPEILDIDVVREDFDVVHKDLFGSFDTIFALNVVEHIEDDHKAVENCVKMLKPNGKLIILVPAFMSLYNRFDEELFHYRRYTKKTLRQLKNSDLKIVHSQYFNVIGIFGWFVSGRILKKKIIPKGQMDLFNRLTPIFKLVDKICLNRFGLSVMMVYQKTN